MTDVKSAPTAAQREWVKTLGSLKAPGTGAAPPAEEPVTGGVTKSLFDPSDLPAIIIKTLTGPHSNVVRINNNTDLTLRLDPKSAEEVDDEGQIGLSHGKFDSLPPDPLGPRSGGEFKASSNTVLGQTLTGVEGRVRYLLDEQGTSWTLHHNNPFKGFNKADAQIDGPNKARFTTPKPVAGGGEDAVFLFTLSMVGSPQPPVPPGPTPPGPTPPAPTPTDVPASCLVTITNKTKHVLTLLDNGHARGDFQTFPAETLQPEGSTTFASVETPGAKEEGCKGFLLWQVGTPQVATWRVEWDNPEQEKNTVNSAIDPKSPGLRSLDQIGQGEDNVPTVFTLFGEAAVVPPEPPPVPPPVPPTPPEPEEPFEPPTEARQPTLRRGDKSVDGWVEYLQRLLNDQLGLNLAIDGDFGGGTEKAVIDFQKKNGLQVDKVVGNQTWAALRKGQPEKPSTDGRKPHTFVERGVEARWDTEQQNAVYMISIDEMVLFITSVGDQRIDEFTATIRVTPPNTPPKTVKVKIGPPTKEFPSGAGFAHVARLNDFKKRFPATDPNAKVTDYKLEAYLDKELGGDLWTGGKVVEGG